MSKRSGYQDDDRTEVLHIRDGQHVRGDLIYDADQSAVRCGTRKLVNVA